MRWGDLLRAFIHAAINWARGQTAFQRRCELRLAGAVPPRYRGTGWDVLQAVGWWQAPSLVPGAEWRGNSLPGLSERYQTTMAAHWPHRTPARRAGGPWAAGWAHSLTAASSSNCGQHVAALAGAGIGAGGAPCRQLLQATVLLQMQTKANIQPISCLVRLAEWTELRGTVTRGTGSLTCSGLSLPAGKRATETRGTWRGLLPQHSTTETQTLVVLSSSCCARSSCSAAETLVEPQPNSLHLKPRSPEARELCCPTSNTSQLNTVSPVW